MSERLLLAGRVASEPMPIPGGDGSTVATLHVFGRAIRANTWMAVFGPALRLPRPLRRGDTVALIGAVDRERENEGDLFGPIAVEAVLALDGDGVIFRDGEAEG